MSNTSPSKSAPPGDRIAKVIARAGIASRRDAEVIIAEGRVTVNGQVIESAALNVTDEDRVAVDGVPLAPPERARLWMYHKPTGLVTTTRDEQGRETVFDALPDDLPRVMTVGRLDLNSEGLLLLTNDGELKRRLELPSTGWLRRYRVRVRGTPTEAQLEAMRGGLTVEGERFAPMQVAFDRQQGGNAWLTLGLREGKNREIRRAMESQGLLVNRLIRLSYGPFQLGTLAIGEIEEVRTRVLRDQLGEPEMADETETRAPGKPGPGGRKPGGKPAGKFGGKPAGKFGGKPGGRPGGKPGEDRGDRPARKPYSEDRGDRPARKPYGKPGEDRGDRPARKPYGKPGEDRGDRPARKPYGKPGEDRGERPARKPYGKPGEDRGDRPARKPYGKPGEDRGDRPARKPYGKPGEDRGDRPARKPYGKPGEDRGDRPARKPYGKPGEDRGDRPARKPYGKPGEDRGDRPARKPYGKPGEDRGDRPARKPYGKPGEDRGDRPARKPYGKPGEDRGDRPARKPYGEDRGDRKPFGKDRPDNDRSARREAEQAERAEKKKQFLSNPGMSLRKDAKGAPKRGSARKGGAKSPGAGFYGSRDLSSKKPTKP